MHFKDTNNRSGMIHMNSDRMYFLSGVANSETWTQVNSQWALYLQMNTNQAVFSGNIPLNTGNIQSSKFKVTQAGNVTGNNTFTTSTSATEVTIANNVGCSGGTIVFHISCGGYATTAGLKTLNLRYKVGQGNFRATITASIYFNQTGIHAAWSRSQIFTGIPAANMVISVAQNDKTLIFDSNDFITVVMEVFPF
jgi:lipopolysaccharide export system protein LptA